MSNVTRYCYKYDEEHEAHTAMSRIPNNACVVFASDYDALLKQVKEHQDEACAERIARLQARAEAAERERDEKVRQILSERLEDWDRVQQLHQAQAALSAMEAGPKPEWHPQWIVDCGHGCMVGACMDDGCYVTLLPNDARWQPTAWIPPQVVRFLGTVEGGQQNTTNMLREVHASELGLNHPSTMPEPKEGA
jgi:hypothetical protein